MWREREFGVLCRQAVAADTVCAWKMDPVDMAGTSAGMQGAADSLPQPYWLVPTVASGGL